jgi:hypothetical protein
VIRIFVFVQTSADDQILCHGFLGLLNNTDLSCKFSILLYEMIMKSSVKETGKSYNTSFIVKVLA